ncbi:type II toxin-antitoxin system RelE/ParE family toxin [Aquimarina sp. ERC-38]|uniref:type II toxin-antitoxin system RelE/ParE family toxin n=1 Tax=Aquimarina sp. ERC-38 TaxID=2949996 RepID=UPI0022460906|nr:type II toxin-antitoxin system RelE/ParE family toxin [Aquimarina sp. ERC-38]UZO82459.1 type II toxin-antitoxin system RelE/ParE family toxin [Aquimarina sp. ERC-38]
MYKSIILPLAKEDIKETAKWYNKRQKGLGKRFTKEVRKTVNYICKNPESITIRYKNYRTAIVDVFPYMIHFIIDRDNKKIIIIAVFAMARNPKHWGRRIE